MVPERKKGVAKNRQAIHLDDDVHLAYEKMALLQLGFLKERHRPSRAEIASAKINSRGLEVTAEFLLNLDNQVLAIANYPHNVNIIGLFRKYSVAWKNGWIGPRWCEKRLESEP